MLGETETWTGYADVDRVLRWFLTEERALLGSQFVGMYLYGSLALGDFDPINSDIDFIVVTRTLLDAATIDALRDLHTRFDVSGLPKAGRIEAAYVERAALRAFPPGDQVYPQVEADRGFFVEPLEMGWIFQCSTLREHGVVVAGPPPNGMIPPLDPAEMRRAAVPIARMWQRDAVDDPTWLPWLRERTNASFVVLTLCRLLYSIELAAVASKPGAARWAQQRLGEPWSRLIQRAIEGKYGTGQIEPWEEQQILALIDHTVRLGNP